VTTRFWVTTRRLYYRSSSCLLDFLVCFLLNPWNKTQKEAVFSHKWDITSI
jgi:hypothetical protein